MQHVLDMQVLALNQERENVMILSSCFDGMKMSDHKVWAFERNVGFVNRLLLASFIEKCSSRELVYVTIHSSNFVRC